MELTVDKKLIRASRRNKAWSQEQLADISGLGLRTVQRIEATGVASYESAKALSSSLELPLSDILETKSGFQLISYARRSSKTKAISIASIISAAVFMLFMRSAVADQVSIGLAVQLENRDLIKSRLVTDENQEASVRIDDRYEMAIIPVVSRTGEIHLHVRLLKFNGVEFVEVARPRIVTESGLEVQLNAEELDSTLLIGITPTLI